MSSSDSFWTKYDHVWDKIDKVKFWKATMWNVGC